jgi:hypothetical protein
VAKAVLARSHLLEAAGYTLDDLKPHPPRPEDLVVRLVDVEGKPVFAEVKLTTRLFNQKLVRSGTTDMNGRIVFRDLTGSYHQLTAEHPHDLSERLQRADTPLPTEEELADWKWFPPTRIDFTDDGPAVVELQEIDVAAAVATFPPFVTTAESWARTGMMLSFDKDLNAFPPVVHYLDAEAGRLVLGPLLPGIMYHPSVGRERQPNPFQATFRSWIDKLEPNEVRHVELEPIEPRPAPATRPSTRPKWEQSVSWSRQRPLQHEIQVRHSDGTAAASGVHVIHFVRQDARATNFAFTDGAGLARLVEPYIDALGMALPGRESVGLKPFLIAHVPGKSGATILPLSDVPLPDEITLPPAADLIGTVRVGDAEPPAEGVVEVVARPVHPEARVADLLTLRTFAQRGRFELLGVTPDMEYDVQASVDGIWLSETRRVCIPEEGEPAAVELAVAPLGGGVRVRVLEHSGKPAAGVRLVLDRPDGPRMRETWIHTFQSDADGIAVVPALEAGSHRVALSRHPDVAATVDVAPLGEPAVEVELRLPPRP